jgi:hypothetical protein
MLPVTSRPSPASEQEGNADPAGHLVRYLRGAEKKQTNHWFVTSEQEGELRARGWNSRMRLGAGSKHLYGQNLSS